MGNNEQSWPAALLWKQIIDVKTDGMAEKNSRMELWRGGLGGSRTGISKSSTQIRYRSQGGAVTVHVTRDSRGKLWWQTWLAASRWGSRVLSVREAFPVGTGMVLHMTQRWCHVHRSGYFLWAVQKHTSTCVFYFLFLMLDIGLPRIPSLMQEPPLTFSDCHLQRGAQPAGCPRCQQTISNLQSTSNIASGYVSECVAS